uniref:Uncharacterized protein n=1 Tax=Sphaerodactylus townsendi TaxID=933632 RepID=A0ACB8FSN7_9SAUR
MRPFIVMLRRINHFLIIKTELLNRSPADQRCQHAVKYGPDTVVISPSGNITQLFGSPLTLHCSADSVPAAQYSWFFNNTTMDRHGSLLIINFTEWEHEGTYECWAYNDVTNLTGQASVSVVIDKESPSAHLSLTPGLILGIVTGLLVGLVLIAILAYCYCAHVRRKNLTSAVSRCDNHTPPDLQTTAGVSTTFISGISETRDRDKTEPVPNSNLATAGKS